MEKRITGFPVIDDDWKLVKYLSFIQIYTLLILYHILHFDLLLGINFFTSWCTTCYCLVRPQYFFSFLFTSVVCWNLVNLMHSVFLRICLWILINTVVVCFHLSLCFSFSLAVRLLIFFYLNDIISYLLCHLLQHQT